MKLSYLFAAALIAGLAISSSANAVTVNLTGNHYDFTNPVVAGQTGSITTDKIKSYGDREYRYAGGVLAASTEIVFTYKTNTNTAGTLFADSNNTKGNTYFDILANSFNTPSVSIKNPLVTVLANFSAGTGTATIKNMSSVAVDFFTYFLAKNNKTVTASYVASAVPLPSAVILFVSGLLVLVGFAAYRKKADQI